jgi:lipoate-protein ligase A
MEKWRLLFHPANDAYTNMAIDEALLVNGTPTLRLYSWVPSAISIGYFQSITDEVNISECKKQGVDVVRRITGGGAVYHDENGEITYSFVCPQHLVPSKILDSYTLICTALASGLNQLGLNAQHAGINDILVNGKKISGSAQTRRYDHVLQHGTILTKVDVKKMFSLLQVSDKKISDKAIDNVKQRVTSIENELGMFDMKQIRVALIKGFEDHMGLSFTRETLSKKERDLASEIRGKYESKEWNFKR